MPLGPSASDESAFNSGDSSRALVLLLVLKQWPVKVSESSKPRAFIRAEAVSSFGALDA